MNKKLLYSIGIVLTVGAIGFIIINNPSGSSTTATEGSLKELLASQSPQRCTFAQQSTGADSSGEVYVANGKMRGDFSSLVEGKMVKSHMIIDGDVSYVWTDLMNQGFKVSLKSMTAQKPGQAQGVDLNQKLSYSCNSWTADQAIFGMPSGVTFTDMTTLINQMAPQVEVKTTGSR